MAGESAPPHLDRGPGGAQGRAACARDRRQPRDRWAHPHRAPGVARVPTRLLNCRRSRSPRPAAALVARRPETEAEGAPPGPVGAPGGSWLGKCRSLTGLADGRPDRLPPARGTRCKRPIQSRRCRVNWRCGSHDGAVSDPRQLCLGTISIVSSLMNVSAALSPTGQSRSDRPFPRGAAARWPWPLQASPGHVRQQPCVTASPPKGTVRRGGAEGRPVGHRGAPRSHWIAFVFSPAPNARPVRQRCSRFASQRAARRRPAQPRRPVISGW
jgi:hypothetical protein